MPRRLPFGGLIWLAISRGPAASGSQEASPAATHAALSSTHARQHCLASETASAVGPRSSYSVVFCAVVVAGVVEHGALVVLVARQRPLPRRWRTRRRPWRRRRRRFAAVAGVGVVPVAASRRT